MKKYTYLLSAILSGLLLTTQATTPTIYLSQARHNPFERHLFLDGQSSTFRYTAFYQGSSQPETDIPVYFRVDPVQVQAYNAKHGTSYKMLPAESYSLSLTKATIVKGSVAAPSGEAEVIGSKPLKAFEKYLLPISVTTAEGSSVTPDSTLSTIYYVIQAVPAPGTVTRKQIGHISPHPKSVFKWGDHGLLVIDQQGELSRYRYTGNRLTTETPPTGGNHLAEMDDIILFKNGKLIGLYRKTNNGQLWSFPVEADGGNIGPVEKVFGTSGYNIFSDITPYGNILYCRKPDGELMCYPLSDSMEWNGEIRSLGSGWDYKVIFGYGNSLIVADKQGDLWKYPLLAQGQTGLPLKIGSGWNIFSQIVVFGNDLLCIEPSGDVWRITFGDEGFWAL